MIQKTVFRKYFILFCLVGAIVFAPVCSANAGSYHRGDRLLAAAVGGAMVGLVGAAVHSILTPSRTVVVEEPAYVSPAPVFVIREPHHHRPMHPVRYARRHHRYR